MNWQTAMNLDLIESQANAANRQAEHDKTVRTLKDLIDRDAPRRAFWQGVLVKYQEKAWDL